MSFDERFELGELLRDDGVRTFAVRDRAGGQDLVAHFLAHAPEAATLLASLQRLPERERQRIVDRGERDGVPYVVTGSLPGHPGFREWLASNAHEPRSLESAGAWKVVLPENSVDEQFLALFPTGERAQSAPEQVVPRAEPIAPRAEQKEPGEFTRLFQAPPMMPTGPVPAAKPPAPAAPQVTPPPQAAPAAQPAGEFTRMFQAQAQPAPTRAQPAKPEGPGEFTRFFEAQVNPPSPRNPAPSASAPIQAAPKPGEFTQFFEAQPPRADLRNPVVAPVPPVQPVHSGPKQGEFTKVFGPGEVRSLAATPLPTRPEPVPPAPAPAPATGLFAAPKLTPAAAAPPGPGDYTRQFSAPPALTLGQTPQETRPPIAASTGRAGPANSALRSRWPLILGITAVVVLVAVLVVFIASRSK